MGYLDNTGLAYFWGKIKDYISGVTPIVNLVPSVYYQEKRGGWVYEYRGVTWTLNNDGSVTATGKATGGNSTYYITYNTLDDQVPSITIDDTKYYTVSGCPSGGNSSTYSIHTQWFTANQTPSNSGGSVAYDIGDGYTTNNYYRYVNIILRIYENYQCPEGGITFYPQLEIGSVKHKYIPTHNRVIYEARNTTGASDSSSKLFLIGATSQSDNSQTYSHDTAYVNTNGHLYSNSKQVVNLSDSQALTNKTYNGYTLGAACAKGVDSTINDTNTGLPETSAVYTAIQAVRQSKNIVYGTCTTASATANKEILIDSVVAFNMVAGAIIGVKFTYTNTAENPTFTLIDASVSGTSESVFANTSVITTSNLKYAGTAGQVMYYMYDGTYWVFMGHSFDNNDNTKNTAGATDSSSKLFIIGATAQDANPQTYSQDTAYVGTDGHLYSNSVQAVNLSDSQALTNKTYNGYTLGAACAKGVDTSIAVGSTSTKLPTSKAVADAIAAAQVGAALFQGTISSNTTISSLSDYKKGWYWVVATAGTYVGETCEVGDMIFCVSDRASAYSASDFSVIQNNLITITNAEIDTIVAA